MKVGIYGQYYKGEAVSYIEILLQTLSKKNIEVNDFLVTESALQININNEPYTVVMRTPNDDVELIRG